MEWQINILKLLIYFKSKNNFNTLIHQQNL